MDQFANKRYVQTKITTFFKPIVSITHVSKPIEEFPSTSKVYGYNKETDEWHCLSCGISMGTHNPRQLCKKTYCENEQWSYFMN